MSILTTEARDYEAIAAQIGRRMSQDRDSDVQIRNLRSHGGGAGFSNETLLATMTENGLARDVVLRLGPTDPAKGLFPEYDIPRQYHVMKALEATGRLAVAHGIWLDPSTDIFGSPFYLMDKIEADVPADVPPITVSGFVFDASEGDREAFWWSQLDAIATLDQVDWEAVGLGFLWPDRTRSPLEAQIDHYERCYRWGRGASPELPAMERAIAWLRANTPHDEPERFCWGDARTTNFMFRDMRVVALLDWEMAHIGNPECDLAYFIGHHELLTDYPLPEFSRPRMAGIPSVERTIARFETRIGRSVRHFDYYTVFNCFKNLASMQRFCELVHGAGMMTRAQADAIKDSGGGNAAMMMRIVDR